MNPAEKLIIFDYSGTLSTESPQFGRPENLDRALKDSGLALLGVTPALFWKEIVDPTWDEASTTAIGYMRIMTQQIMALGLATGKTGPEIEAAASRFVESYLAHSRIDPHWRPVLQRLADGPDVALVIATDHYAEMTATMIGHLASWNIRAQKVGAEAANPGRPAPVVVANSADIGFWKADRRFWEVVSSRLAMETIRSVLVIDDFGFNEEEGGRYSEASQVAARQEKTLSVLKEVLGAGIEAVPFFLRREHMQEAAAAIAETGERIMQWVMIN